jgi:hypothetical protein
MAKAAAARTIPTDQDQVDDASNTPAKKGKAA